MQRVFRRAIPLVAMWCAVVHADAVDRRVIHVADGVYALQSDDSVAAEDRHRPINVAFIIGPRGVAVVDTGSSSREGERIIAAIERITRRPIRAAILTHPGPAAIFGAAAFQARGIPVLMHRDAARLMANRCESCLQDLQDAFGRAAMAGTRVVVPDRLVDADGRLDLIGRRLRLIAPARSSAPGAIAVLDERTATLFAGSIVSIDTVPDTRDGDAAGWRATLATLAGTRCRHLIPSQGAVARCSGIGKFVSYFDALEARVAGLLREGVGLAELAERGELPEYSTWARYDALHRANVSRAYLRLEREAFGMR
jgi:glyoxylase-like metal-dependent hydrolase (beta-lactamase superfamily II)